MSHLQTTATNDTGQSKEEKLDGFENQKEWLRKKNAQHTLIKQHRQCQDIYIDKTSRHEKNNITSLLYTNFQTNRHNAQPSYLGVIVLAGRHYSPCDYHVTRVVLLQLMDRHYKKRHNLLSVVCPPEVLTSLDMTESPRPSIFVL